MESLKNMINSCIFWKRDKRTLETRETRETREKCKNYNFCLQEHPEWVLKQYNGYCHNCATVVGPLKLNHLLGECPICFEDKSLVQVFCGKHETCIECWIKIIEHDSICPFCLKHLFDI